MRNQITMRGNFGILFMRRVSAVGEKSRNVRWPRTALAIENRRETHRQIRRSTDTRPTHYALTALSGERNRIMASGNVRELALLYYAGRIHGSIVMQRCDCLSVCPVL